jgi:hypothetical protein
MHHFTWDNDAPVTNMPKQKGDQAGDHILPKYIYANSYFPELCPILTLSLHVFSTRFGKTMNTAPRYLWQRVRPVWQGQAHIRPPRTETSSAPQRHA